jgi:TPR repeat protein
MMTRLLLLLALCLCALPTYSAEDKPDIEALTKKAEAGDGEAQATLGEVYYEQADYESAFQWFIKAAEQELAVALHNLGHMYEDGKGVPQDHKEAVHWYRKAAEQEYCFSQYNLGSMYRKGLGIGQDHTKAIEWYTRAANQGDARAQHDLGLMYAMGLGIGQDHTKAIEWYTKAAEQGFADAQHKLGVAYFRAHGVAQDYQKARAWWVKAAEQGHPEAQLAVKTVEVAIAQQIAAKTQQSAAEQGDVEAQYKTAQKYIIGDGVPEDFVIAYAWLIIAADNGHERAPKKRDSIKATLKAAQIERGEALAKEIAERVKKVETTK